MMIRIGCLVVLALLVAPAAAQEWSRFRGENGTGVSDARTVPTRWTEKDLNWKIRLPGSGHSSPVQYGKTLFVLSADPDSGTKHVLAVDSESGKVKWNRRFEAGTYRFHRLNSYNSSTPAADAERVYVSWSDKARTTLLALTHEGQIVWQKELGNWVGQHGFAASPMVYRDKVILANSQQKDQLRPGQKAGQSVVYAFEGKTGKLAWKSERVTTRVSYAMPCVFKNESGAEELICCNRGEGVYSLNPENGQLNWSYENAFDKRTVASPIIANGLILGSCGSGGGGNFVVAVSPGEKPTLKYKIDRNANYVPTPVAVGDLVFLVSDKGIATCVNANNGEVVWRERLKGEHWASPVCVNGNVYAINSTGEVTVFAAAETFRKTGSAELGEKCHSTPAVADGKMVLRTVSHLMSVGGR